MSTLSGSGKANELTLQNDMIRQLVANGWLLGKPENYNRELALYTEDVLGFVKDTQDSQWQKFCGLYPNNPAISPGLAVPRSLISSEKSTVVPSARISMI